ncbi:MAG: membrane protein insertion efficiency factor YidD [Nitrospinales bacterium]
MLKRFFIAVIKSYQRFVSPLMAPACRFHPTCSEYAAQALARFDGLKAFRLILFRLCKCHPYHDGGRDPVK